MKPKCTRVREPARVEGGGGKGKGCKMLESLSYRFPTNQRKTVLPLSINEVSNSGIVV